MYSSRLKMIIAADCIVIVTFIAIIIPINEGLPNTDIPVIPALVSFLLIWAFIIIAFSIKFPMWDGIWKTPKWQTAAYIILGVGLIAGIILEEGTSYCSSLVIVLINVNNLVNHSRSYRMAIKYDLDHLGSVQELISLHPETEELINERKKSLE